MNCISYSIDHRISSATLLQMIVFAEELHVIFNRLLKVECNVAAKIVFAEELHVMFNRSLKVECNVAVKELYLRENCMAYSTDH
uniref:Uncharacterized protein n=1 Tax=viral metagenome TaxID=1070528 RepID=A0A6C0C7D7_9ZZZZ